MSSTVTSKGQATIPKEIRAELRLKAGEKLKWYVDVHGRMIVLREVPLSSLRGVLRGKKPLLLESIEEAAAAGAVERYERIRRQK